MSSSMHRKRLSILLIACLLAGLAGSFAAAAAPQESLEFTDIGSSPYKSAIEALRDEGIVEGTGNGLFQPLTPVTKAQAAAFLQRAFKLAEITPFIYPEDPELEKKVIYETVLDTVTEANMVPAAADIADHWAFTSIEGILSAELADAAGRKYAPDEVLTEKAFNDMLAKAIYGAQKNIDHLEQAVADGFIPADSAASTDTLTREKAAYLLHRIVGDNSFQIITLFATSDIHGNLIPYTPSGSKVEIGSLAKMSSIIQAWRDKHPDTLLLDSGDAPYNSNIANFFEGASTIDVMNNMGYDAMTLGNHDFDYALEVLERNALSAEFPFLSANTYYKDGTYPSFLKPYVVKEVGGVKIAIVGVTDDNSKLTTHFKNTVDIDFHDDLTIASEIVSQVREESDIVVALAHLHGKNRELPLAAPGIDIEIGGGNDLIGPPEVIGDTWLINPGKHSEVLNQISVNVYNKQLLGLNFNQIFLHEYLPDDPAITAITDGYQAQLEDKLKETVGSTSVYLDGERATVRLKESNLGNIIADAQREFLEADIAFQNGGGVRASADAGDLTLEDIFAMLPFDNTVVLLEAKGKTVWDILENSVSNYPAADGRFLQVSGLSFTFDAAKEAGSRVVSVTLDGQDLDLEAAYKIVVNDFMAGGGDGYSMINILGENPVQDVALLSDTGSFMRNVFADYLAKTGTISPAVEGRITILNEAEGQ